MLRNGYDVFLTYSNDGCREIRMRLPDGLPFPKSIWSKYLGFETFKWTADKTGKAGILKVAPFIEDADEEEWEFDDYLDAITKLRALLISGDVRALYVLWLCCMVDSNEDTNELTSEGKDLSGIEGEASLWTVRRDDESDQNRVLRQLDMRRRIELRDVLLRPE